MRRDGDAYVLSERNLLSLLTKLYTANSACEIVSPDNTWSVKAERDDVHYDSRAYQPGPMHPVTEAILNAVREATVGEVI